MTDDAPKPITRAALFRVFLYIGLTSFGGGASAHIHAAVVERRRWLDEERFLEAMTIARNLPGPNVTNLAAFVGSMLCGYRGAALAVTGIVAPGIVVVLGLAFAYAHLAAPPTSHLFAGTLHGLTAGAVGVMASLVARTLKPAARTGAALLVSVAAFVAVVVFQLNMLLVLVALLPAASMLNRAKAS